MGRFSEEDNGVLKDKKQNIWVAGRISRLIRILIASVLAIVSNLSLAQQDIGKINLKVISSDSKSEVAELLSSRKILMVGEADHRDGSSIELVFQLFDQLIESKWGGTILMEEPKGFWEYAISISKSSDELVKNISSFPFNRSYIRLSVIDFVTQHFEKIKSNQIQIHGLDICDPRSTLEYFETHILTKLKLNEEDNWMRVKKALIHSKVDSVVETELTGFIKYLEEKHVSTEALSILNNVLESKKIWYSILGLRQKLGSNFHGSGIVNQRDSIMAERTRLLLDSTTSSDKGIMIWVSSYHVSKGVIQSLGSKNNDKSMGVILSRMYGDKIYHLGSISYSGCRGTTTINSANANKRASEKLLKPKRRSLERRVYKLSEVDEGIIDFAELDLDKLGLEESFYMNPTYNRYLFENWKNIYDGVLFIRKMKPLKYKYIWQ